jgi:hypothetical protein
VVSPHGTINNNFTLHISYPSEVNGFNVVVVVDDDYDDDDDDVIIVILNCNLGG